MNIFVSQRVIKIFNVKENRDCLDQRVTKIINHCGINPILIPNNLVKKKNNLKLLKFLNNFNSKGVLLTGGDNFGDFQNRDQTEFFLLIPYRLLSNLLMILTLLLDSILHTMKLLTKGPIIQGLFPESFFISKKLIK